MIDFSILLTNNNRSKAYLQNLLSNKLFPSKVIVLNSQKISLPENTENDKLITENTTQSLIKKSEKLNIQFDEKEHVLSTINRNNLDYIVLNTIDINSSKVIKEVNNLKSKYIIYSGPGGTLLREEILKTGKQFIHVHPGWLPDYRGSTTMYYSLLSESYIGASVIILNNEIDAGPILYKKKYHSIDKNIDFDYTLDPLIRAKTLIDFFKTNKLIKHAQTNSNKANTFFIIHPFLKHLSILSFNKKYKQ